MQLCLELGLRQTVREPTRGDYLLDLVLTDLETLASTRVLGTIADHRAVLCKPSVSTESAKILERTVWKYECADWEALNEIFAQTDWRNMVSGDINAAVGNVTSYIFEKAANYIPQKLCKEQKGKHRWINDTSRLTLDQFLFVIGIAQGMKIRISKLSKQSTADSLPE